MLRKDPSRSIGRGLARYEPAPGSIVVFAAKEGQIALDGDAPNSPFATAFLKNLKVPKLDVRRLFDLVRDDVMETTGRRQQPFAYSSVSGREEFYFLTTPVGLTPTTPQISDPIVPGQQEPTAPTARLKMPDRFEPGQQALPALTLYEEDPADPNGKRFVGSVIWRTETVTPGPGQTARACHPRRRRGARAQARDDLVAPSQYRQGAARDPRGGDHVQTAAGFPLGRHLQRSRHPDEASRADSRRAARRPRGEGDARLLSHRPLERGRRQGSQSAIAQGAQLVRYPVVYNNNRRAIIAMEKGIPGDNVFAEAFKTWELPVATSRERPRKR